MTRACNKILVESLKFISLDNIVSSYSMRIQIWDFLTSTPVRPFARSQV